MTPRPLLAVAALASLLPAQGYVASADLEDAHLCFDEARGRLLGFHDDVVLEWDGSHWVAQSGVRPLRRNTMIYVPWERRFVAALGRDLYAYDGAEWQLLHRDGPWWLGNSQLHIDPVNRELYATAGGVPGVIKRWTGGGWDSQVVGVPNRIAFQFAFDAQRSTFVLEALEPTTSTYETHELTPTGWTLRHSGPDRHGTLVYDPGRGLVLGIGGSPHQTWTWDGITWNVLATTTVTPMANNRPAVDPVSGRLFTISSSFGPGVVNVLDSTNTWTRLPTSHPTVAMTDVPGFTFDSSRGRAVLIRDDSLHEYDGETWHHLPTGAPLAHRNFAQAYDAARQRTVIFGGIYPTGTSSVISDETSLWDGNTWTTVPGTSPSPRMNAAMTYDPNRQVVMLVGGRTGVPSVQSYATDHWEWNGATWSQVSAVTPMAAGLSAMAHDVARARTVFVDTNSRTWEYDGTTWLVTSGASHRPTGPRLVWDEARQHVVGPLAPTPSGLTGIFEWDGTSWTRIPEPQERYLAYDPTRGTLLFWNAAELRATSLVPIEVEPYGSPCGGQTVVTRLAATGRPHPGALRFGVHLRTEALQQPAAIALGVGRSNTPLGTGCAALVQNPIAVQLHTTSAEGIVEQRIALPANPALIGTSITAQGAALDPASTAGIAVSQGLEITIGG